MRVTNNINKVLLLMVLLFIFRTGVGGIIVQAADISFSPPLRGSTTNSSGYGDREGGFHYGVDLTGTEATPIYAVADGIVMQADDGGPGCSASQCGNWVSIQHEGTINGQTGVTSSYLHLSKIEINKADSVKQGQLIGYMGTTGYSTGVHLHFQIDIGSFYTNARSGTTGDYLQLVKPKN
jgi:murein DD-endopeptidase MepM/ murein hydrolase activator NlpD